MDLAEAGRTLLQRWAHNPVLFARQVFGADPWAKQCEVLQAVDEHPYVATRSGHKVGKSWVDAAVAHWWVCTRPGGLAVFTAPAGHQVENVLWPEFRRLYEVAARRGYHLGGHLYDDYHKGLRYADGRNVRGLTTRDPEAFAGISAPNLLLIVDEASGFPQKIFDAVFGNSTGGGHLLLTGNPTRTSGTFFDAFHSKRAAWKNIRVSSRETPNFTPGARRIQGLASPEGVAQLEAHFGVGSPVLEVRVEGNFPRGGICCVVSLGQVEDAENRWLDHQNEPPPDEPLYVGLDCGREGDDQTVAVPRRGHRALAVLDGLPKGDGPDTAGRVMQALHSCKINGRELVRPAEKPIINVDVIGVGTSVFDALKRRDDCVAVPVNGSSSPTVEPPPGTPGYHNLRAQLHFETSHWLSNAGEIPQHSLLQGDLLAPEYFFDSNGRFQVEEKKQIKSKLGRSPDHGDALALSIFEGDNSLETWARAWSAV